MEEKNYDFCGWATRNDLECSDGRTIRRDAFAHQDGMVVPLVWQHQHNDPANVVGKVRLENRPEGVRAYGTFNDTEKGKIARQLVSHGDVTSLSIWANQLKQKAHDVLHGTIREVSLVLSGANPGAFIDFPIVEHSGEEIDTEAIIYTGEEIELWHSDEEQKEAPKEEPEETKEGEKKEVADEKKEKTVKDVFDELTEEQKKVVYFMIGQVAKGNENDEDDKAEHSAIGEDEMKHNVFDGEQYEEDGVLSHDAMETIFKDAKRIGSLRDSFLAHAAEYGIDQIEWLFPEARSVNPGSGAPEFVKRQPDEWVSVVMNGVHHTPFARIKMMFADLRGDEARAKGYAVKGKLKKEEVFGLLKRAISPTTVYKKQKLDRDDVVDITDFDVVSWLKGEMRMMLDEELARAFLFGDGRSTLDEDKISEANIIPIVSDDNFYSIKKVVTPEQDEELGHAIIRSAVKALDDYEGSGNTIFFTKQTYVSDMLLMEDGFKHRLYNGVNDIANGMNIKKIVTVPNAIVPDDVYGIIVDLKDYNVGADKGGAVNMFDDFDIDYNQMKYLIETRCSGALTRPFAAIVLKSA